MPHVKVSMFPTYSRTAQLPTNQEAQQGIRKEISTWEMDYLEL